MSSMAQDAVDMGLDPEIAPDGREWCDSIYGRPAINKEIWGEIDDCEGFQGNKISLDGHREHSVYQNYDASDFSEECINNSKGGIEMEAEESYYILKNLIARIGMEKQSLSYITNIELKSLKNALNHLDPKKTQMSDEDNNENIDLDDFEDDIPF